MQSCTSPERASPAIVGLTNSKRRSARQPSRRDDGPGDRAGRPATQTQGVRQRLGDRLLRRPRLTPSSPRRAGPASTSCLRSARPGKPRPARRGRRASGRCTSAPASCSVLDGGPCRSSCRCSDSGWAARPGRVSQWLSWITLADEIGAIRFLLDQDDFHGPANLTAPCALHERRVHQGARPSGASPDRVADPPARHRVSARHRRPGRVAALHQRPRPCRRPCSTPAIDSATAAIDRALAALLEGNDTPRDAWRARWAAASPRSTSTER